MSSASVPPPVTSRHPELASPDRFSQRHLGPSDADISEMLAELGYDSLDALTRAVVPESIRLDEPLALPDAISEREALTRLGRMAADNRPLRSCLGMGYYGTVTPSVVLRNVLENPAWYTQYTPYQAEIAQGRLEALLNFQTMVSDLTGLPLANASLLDEATAAAEAMAMCVAVSRGKRTMFYVAEDCHPQTINVIRTRAWTMGLELRIGPVETAPVDDPNLAGVLVQYPNTYGRIGMFDSLAAGLHEHGSMLVAATDLLALVLLKSPGAMGADIAVGSAQRFGVPMGFGGPHAAFMATHEKHARRMPGRIVGVSRDAQGNKAYRLAIQTREQHIKRERATSNICTAQVLLAIMASMYSVYHGPEGLRRIARRVNGYARALAVALERRGVVNESGGAFFDTLHLRVDSADRTVADALDQRINLRKVDATHVCVALDEVTDHALVQTLVKILAAHGEGQPAATDDTGVDVDEALHEAGPMPAELLREDAILTHPVFHRYHAEHEMLRYLHRLASRDLSMTTSMIPLGSCTMKLNAASEMLPVTWPQFADLHPFAPAEQAEGYHELFEDLEQWLAVITGFDAVSLQPNAGSQGEYAGLLAIRGYHHSRGEAGRDVCLIPASAHGTNPASAVIAGFRVVAVQCDDQGNINVADLRAKAEQHAEQLGALMITYPSTHGVFEETIREVCAIVHEHGGQVYLDGANMNALVGVCRPADFGADVCHINLHKTFCIPHGGGGPGMGPIAMREHLAPFAPGHPLQTPDFEAGRIGPVSAAPYGSPAILPISWMYIRMMGSGGLRKATQTAILNANYLANRLSAHFPVLYTGRNGRVAHEFILDTRHFHVSAAVEVDDLAKRLMDYGFHAPTMSWPVAGTLMIEPTESESRHELDRFAEAMISIRGEIAEIEQARADLKRNVLKNAPHTAMMVAADAWDQPYSREQAAYPVDSLREYKYWPPVARIDNPYGDRNLVCTCPSVDSLAEQ